MRRGFILILMLISLLVLISLRCANPIAPTGGEKDFTPPGIVQEKSTPNFQTLFSGSKILLTFDEWIKLDKPQQIVTSPPFQKRIKTTLKGKSLEVIFPEDEALKDSVTYTINFGDAIQDITESNKLTNYRFVFSTGPHIDSFNIQGNTYNAETLEPLENITVMLHAELTDSIVYQETPYYFARTDKSGSFRIENAKEGYFKVFALFDADQNYMYNPATEDLGFLDTLIQLPRDISTNLSLAIFKQKPAYKRLQVQNYQNNLRYVFNRLPADISMISTGDYPLQITQNLDTLEIWHQIPTADTLFFFDDFDFRDTLLIEPDSLPVDPRLFTMTDSKKRSRLFPGNPVELNFNRPISTIDTGLITLYDSASQKIPITLLTGSDQKSVLINANWLTGFPYHLQILPNTITGWGGMRNGDTLDISLTFASIEEFGTIKLTFAISDSSKTYIGRLLNKDQVVNEFVWEEQASLSLLGIAPGSYTLRIFADINQNGIWDPGHYLRKINPEPVWNFKIANLRANWEMDVPISLQ